MPGTKAGVLNNAWLQFLASGAGGVYKRKAEVLAEAAPGSQGSDVDALERGHPIRRILRFLWERGFTNT